MIRFRKNDELLGAIASPARGYRNAIFFVDEVTKFAGVEERWWWWRFHTREEGCSILTHFPPLLTTFPGTGQ